MTQVLNRRDLYDGETAARYRRTDEAIQNDPECVATRARLVALTSEGERPLRLLDVGCGTGRWFHAYRNVARLVGIDTSPEMLQKARTPVRSDHLDARAVRLVCTDIFELTEPAASFDLIVSIGVLGQHARFDGGVCARLHELLTPCGRAFFTIVDAASMPKSAGKRLAEVAYPVAPGFLRRMMDARRRTFFMTRASLEQVLHASPLEVLEVSRRVSTSNNWLGAYFECLVRKGIDG